MAVVVYTGTNLSGAVGNAAVYTWSALATGDTGALLSSAAFADRSVQVGGTFGGATCTIEGSNDGVNFATLTDTAGVALTFTTAGLKQILQITRYIRPSISGGAAASININLVAAGK